MTLKQAIEIETIHNDHNPNFTEAERRAAHQLGIEALKLIYELRHHHNVLPDYLLPGETEE